MKMRCERIRELFTDYLNGDLSAPLRILVDKHREECPICDRELRKLEKLRQTLHSFPKVSPPPDFAPRVVREFLTRRERKPAFLRDFLLGGLEVRRALVYGAVALVVAVALALLYLLPWGTIAKELRFPFPFTLKRSPIPYYGNIGKVVLIPQTGYPLNGRVWRLEITLYPPAPEMGDTWLSIYLSPGLSFPQPNPFMPVQRDIYLGRLRGNIAFFTDILKIADGVNWVKVECRSGGTRWGEGVLLIPSTSYAPSRIALAEYDIDALPLLAKICANTGKTISLSVPLGGRVNFYYEGEPEGAINAFASLYGLVAVKYDNCYLLELP